MLEFQSQIHLKKIQLWLEERFDSMFVLSSSTSVYISKHHSHAYALVVELQRCQHIVVKALEFRF